MKITHEQQIAKAYESYRKRTSVRRFIPLMFPRTCEIYKQTYVREPMWEVTEPYVHFTGSNYLHFCRNCIHTKQEMKMFAEQNIFLKPHEFDLKKRPDETETEHTERLKLWAFR